MTAPNLALSEHCLSDISACNGLTTLELSERVLSHAGLSNKLGAVAAHTRLKVTKPCTRGFSGTDLGSNDVF